MQEPSHEKNRALARPVPTVGRIVLFRLDEWRAQNINERRKDALKAYHLHQHEKHGVQLHEGNEVRPGAVYPMIIVAVWGDSPDCAVNGQLLLDGGDQYWVTSVSAGETNGTFHWPGRA